MSKTFVHGAHGPNRRFRRVGAKEAHAMSGCMLEFYFADQVGQRAYRTHSLAAEPLVDKDSILRRKYQ